MEKRQGFFVRISQKTIVRIFNAFSRFIGTTGLMK